jgi:hypothetical protein
MPPRIIARARARRQLPQAYKDNWNAIYGKKKKR